MTKKQRLILYPLLICMVFFAAFAAYAKNKRGGEPTNPPSVSAQELQSNSPSLSVVPIN